MPRPARTPAGFHHETALYSSDAEFLAIVVPFLRAGVAAAEPTIAALGPANAGLVRDALGGSVSATGGVTFIAGDAQYARPAATIQYYRERFGRLTAAGARRIRVVGDVPHPGTGASWHR